MKFSDLIIKRCVDNGIDTAFVVTGGAAMHLNNSIANSKLKVVYLHHEQSCSMAAEAYARVNKKPALVCVTAGPGSINALNGVFGAYTDSIPMIVISGQAKTETSNNFRKIKNLRQLGDQEVDITSMVKKITKSAIYIKNINISLKKIDDIIASAITGRHGPVWIDVPIDIQGTNVTKLKLDSNNFKLKYKNNKIKLEKIKLIRNLITNSKKPLILAGSGINASSTKNKLKRFVYETKIPIVTAWAHDVYNNFDKYYIGRQGTIGNRAGNFAVQNSDLLIVLGSRLNIRQVSYNYKSFAKKAKIIWIDIDKAEFNKKFIKTYLNINCDLNDFFKSFFSYKTKFKKKIGWLKWCNYIKKNFTPRLTDYKIYQKKINVYHFINYLFPKLKNKTIVCADGAATVVPSQIGYLNENTRLIYNSGSASMGYDLPAAIGVSIKSTNKTVCIAGDGSIMMNLQELQTIKNLKLDIIIFVLNNDGYLSIKQTQKNFFGNEHGASSKSNLTFPNFKKISKSFGIKSYSLNLSNYKKKIPKLLKQKGPILCEIHLDTIQEFEPKLKSKFVKNKIITPELDDMYPFLDKKKFDEIKKKLSELTK